MIYTKSNQSVVVSESNLFVYESCVYMFYKNTFSLNKKTYFSSPKEIEGVVGSFFKTPYIQICSELYAAPLKWLKDNGYKPYIKDKVVKKKK